MRAHSLLSCLTLCDPMDCSLPGSSVHGILQARILEWVAMPSSKGSSQPRHRICVSYISCIGRQPPGKPNICTLWNPFLRNLSWWNNHQAYKSCIYKEIHFISLTVKMGHDLKIHQWMNCSSWIQYYSALKNRLVFSDTEIRAQTIKRSEEAGLKLSNDDPIFIF